MTDVVLDAPTRTGSDFAPLLEKVRARGLLRLRRRRYAVMITFDLLALVGVWAIIQVVGNTWWSLFLALPLAIFTVRMIFVAHDVGHRQVARTSRWLAPAAPNRTPPSTAIPSPSTCRPSR